MSSIGWVWWQRYSGREVRYHGLDVIHKVVWFPKELMWCHSEEIRCHECSVCDVIKHDHWCHKVWMWCDVDWVWCHTCDKCDDLHICCDVVDRAIHQYRCVCHLWDDTDTVDAMSNMVGEMSGIVVVLSWKQYGDSVHIGYDVINILGVMLYTEGYDVINSCCDSMHTEYEVTGIVCVMTYREWVWYNWYPLFDDTDTVDVVLDIVGQMADITFVLPCVWCHT